MKFRSSLLLFIFSLFFLHALSSCGSGDSAPDSQHPQTTENIVDADGDGIPDSEDPCPHIKNARVTTSVDLNHDGIPDECTDTDGDGIADGIDNCPTVANPNQADENHNGIGDACADLDTDHDGVRDDVDVCPYDCVFTEAPPSGMKCPSLIGFPEAGDPIPLVNDIDNNKIRDEGFYHINLCPIY